MRFEVPQFIEIEDKIVGPLTWRQFVYVAGGVGILVVLYFWLPLMLFALFGLPLAALAFSLAFHKVNNRPFSIFLESAANYLTKKKLYLWKKDKQQTVTEIAQLRNPQIPQNVGGMGTGSINSLSNKLEHHIPE